MPVSCSTRAGQGVQGGEERGGGWLSGLDESLDHMA
jgi:hypothetical protein